MRIILGKAVNPRGCYEVQQPSVQMQDRCEPIKARAALQMAWRA